MKRLLCNPIFMRLLALLLLNILFALSANAAPNVTATRVWPATDYTRITIEVSEPVKHNMQLLANPDRIVLDVQLNEINAALKSLNDKILAGDPYIKGVRLGKFKPGTVRIVLDLKATAKPELFVLKPVGEYKHRLVLDVYPVRDPLMNLLAEKEKERNKPAETAPAGAVVVEQVPESVKAEHQTVPQETAPAEPTEVAQQTPDNSVTVSSPPPPSTNDSPGGYSPGETQKPAETSVSQPETTAVEAPKPIVQEENIKDKEDDGRSLTIALDAGHGGEDPGARGASGSHEKDITLSIAKKLKAKIDAEPNLRAVLIRDGDYFIPLGGRTAKARKLKADLFISIHADAFTRPEARGSSVFALSERGASSATARYLAKKENESDLIGGVSINVKDRQLKETLLDLSMTATINDSLKLGKAVLGEIGEINTLHKKHVEQAGFAVLKSPDIPSILVETAFISNPEEERRLNDDVHQNKLAESILEGIKKYLANNPAFTKNKATP